MAVCKVLDPGDVGNMQKKLVKKAQNRHFLVLDQIWFPTYLRVQILIQGVSTHNLDACKV